MEEELDDLESLFSEHFGRTPLATPAASQSLESDSDGDTGDTPDDDTPRSVDLGERARKFVDDTPQPETSHPDSDDEHYQNDPDIVLPENDPDVVNIEQLKSTGCGCNNNCMAKFQTQTLFKHILDVNEMEKSDKERYIMATLVDSSASRNETKRGKKRQRGRTEFKLLGKRVCKKVFMLAFDIGKYSLKNIIAHVNEHGPVPRTHAGLGVKKPNALTYDDVHTLVQFISNYADEFGLPQPAAPRGRDNVPPIYLTSQTFKKDVHAKYEASCVESGTDCRVVRLTTFNNIWRQCVPHIKIATPRDDVCAVCETIRKEIMDASSEDEKLATTSKMQGHINSAQTEREIYNDCIKLARSSNDNNDHDKYVHYTFDFSQNVSIPHHSRQMGPVYFKCLRKIQLFGFRIDGHPKQLNFLIDEHETIGKDGTATHGPNAVISMVDWAMEHYGAGEPTCSIHADNCPGQNKNQYVIGYFMWRVMTGKHRQVEYMMQVPGHARCLIDGGFASLKKLYRRTDCDTIDQLQEHTDWANDILKQKKLPLISDLRKSVGDGFMLPTILEIISGTTLHRVKVSPQTKEDRVDNLHNCLTFLTTQGCDVTDINATDLENGNLKSSLLLVGKIKKHFNVLTSFLHVNGHDSGNVDDPSAPPVPIRNAMPGAVKIPGAVPTPFTTACDPSPGRRNEVSSSSPPRKTGYHAEHIIPGTLNREPVNDVSNKPHTALISTTELGTNGVAQHGVDERRQHITTSTASSRGLLLRGSGGTKPGAAPPLPEKPQTVTRAWAGGSPQAQHVQMNGPTSTTVEDRLKQLIHNNSSKRNTTTTTNNNNNNVDSKGYRSGFHGGGSEVFDDGEMLVAPPPQPRHSPDFGMMMIGNNVYGPGYRQEANQQRGQRSNQGYVPSKPNERWHGARADIMDKQPKRSPIIRARQQPASQIMPGMTGRDNYAFTPEGSPATLPSGKNTPNTDFTAAKPPNSPHKPGGSELRNAWNKLYGPNVPSPNVAPAGPTIPSPNGASGQEIQRGNNLRSSHGPHPRQTTGQYSVKFAPSTPSQSARPVSAPAPEHMQQVHFNNQGQGHVSFEGQLQSQGHFQDQEHLDKIDRLGNVNQNTSSQRESPMGQSSSTQGHLEGSTSSQMSGSSHPGGLGQTPTKSQFESYGKSSLSNPSSPNSPNYAIGPAAKYPEMNSQPLSARKPSVHGLVSSPHKQMNDKSHGGNNNKHSDSKNHNLSFAETTSSDKNSAELNVSRHLQFSDDLTTAMHIVKNGQVGNKGSAFGIEDEDFQGRSIFDYEASHSESTSRSVTPPLPPLSPTNSVPGSDSPSGNPSPKLGRSLSATNVSFPKFPDMLPGGQRSGSGKPRRTSELQFRMERRPHAHKKTTSPRRGHGIKGASLNNVQEDISDSESNPSFDIDDTFLTVESHDTEQYPAGEVLTSHEAAALRQQLRDLETMYFDLHQKVSTDKVKDREHRGHGLGPGPPPIGRTRRWSIGSSDTSSFRRESKYKPGKQIHHRHHSREFKNVNKRFQRLESHVVTLARSVAHLSSELRTHNTMVHDLDSIKKELAELKDNPGRAFPNVLGSQLTEAERFRGWVPSLTNPKRVNKLTKFFGVEPPLMELFLKKLGYERYVANFQSEHIGMIELPYMTEERLEKIGVPMGPRLRILQEAQLCFRQENFNIYIV